MRNRIVKVFVISLACLLAAATWSCKEKGYPKPKHLISEKKMANILYDIHLSQAMAERYRRRNSDSIRIDPKAFYQSVLDKYHIEDSVLTKSIIYYSTYPKLYERIYSRVIERMNMEQEEMRKKENIKIPGREEKGHERKPDRLPEREE